MTAARSWWEGLDETHRDTVIHSLYVAFTSYLDKDSVIMEIKQEHITHIENCKSECSMVLKEKDNIINKLINSIDDIKKNTHHNEIDVIIKNNINPLISGLNYIQDMNKVTQEKITSFISDKETNNRKGIEGELGFDSVIRENFIDIDILTDTSGIKGYGDRMLCIDEVDILIEIKNPSQSTLNSHIVTYTKQVLADTQIAKEEKDCNMCILAIMSDTLLPGKNRIEFRTHSTEQGIIGIITVSGITIYPFLLISAIRFATSISKIIKESEIGSSESIDIVNRAWPILKQTLQGIQKNQRLIEELRKNNQECKNSVETIIDSLLPIIDPQHITDDELSIKLINVCAMMMKKNKKVTLSEFQIECRRYNVELQHNTIRRIGFKNIKHKAEQMLLDSPSD